jgi:hypothetical protein
MKTRGRPSVEDARDLAMKTEATGKVPNAEKSKLKRNQRRINATKKGKYYEVENA